MSLEYLALRGTATKSTLANYFAAVRETEDARRDENWAACTIARVWKGYFARKYIAYINEQACTIQRIYRGYVGRIVCERKRQDKIHAIEREYYDSCAVKIQKLFKGYLSRRDKEDFYKRKKWIAHVREKGQELRRQMDEHVDQQIAYNQEKSDYASTLEFEKLTSNLHHLVGTKCTPGVFSSRWGPDFDTTAYDIPMETHLWDAFANKRAAEKTIKLQKQKARHLRRAAKTQKRQQTLHQQYHHHYQQQQQQLPPHQHHQHQHLQHHTQHAQHLPSSQYQQDHFPANPNTLTQQQQQQQQQQQYEYSREQKYATAEPEPLRLPAI